MIALALTNVKEFMSHLLLKETFDHFSFIEGDITTFNTFHIDGFVQKDFFDLDDTLPDYSYWKNVKSYCFSIIKGKKTPLNFRFIFRLSKKNIENLIIQNSLPLPPESVQGLYLNIKYDGTKLTCITGTSFRTFTMDKTLEHVWDEMTESFFLKKEISFERAD